MRAYIRVHISGMFEDDIIHCLCAEAFSRNGGGFVDLSKQAPRHDRTGSAPLIHGRLGPDRDSYSSNTTVLAYEVGDDPPVLDDAELCHRNCCHLAAPKAAAEQDRQDGAVPLTPN